MERERSVLLEIGVAPGPAQGLSFTIVPHFHVLAHTYDKTEVSREVRTSLRATAIFGIVSDIQVSISRTPMVPTAGGCHELRVGLGTDRSWKGVVRLLVGG